MVTELSDQLLSKIRTAIISAKPFTYYWDYRDELSDAHINKLLMLPDGKEQVYEEISEYNVDAFGQVEHYHILEILKGYTDEIAEDLDEDVENITESMLDELYYQYDLACSSPGIDADFRTLVSNTKPRAVLQLKLYQEHAGFEWRQCIEYSDVRHVLTFFNINPRKVLRRFPNLFWRNGNEYLLPKDLIELWDNASYGGQYVIPINLDLWDFIERRDNYFTGIILPENTEIWLHDYFNGSGSISVCLQKELRVYRKKIDYTFGDDKKTVGYGLDKVYGLSSGCWKNDIYPIAEERVNHQQLKDSIWVVDQFVYGNAITNFQNSSFISAYYSHRVRADYTIPEYGELMESNIAGSLWVGFPYSAKRYLRSEGNKFSDHLAVRFFEYLGQVEVFHCQMLVEADTQKVVWAQVETSARSREIFEVLKSRIEKK
jgi:hypothetical protein